MLTGELVGIPILGHTCYCGVRSVAISRNSRIIMSGDCYGMVRRWDASTGKAIGEPMDGHSDLVSAVVINDDGWLIVTGYWDATITRWAAGNGSSLTTQYKCIQSIV